jgi:soluble lytic murein transglycosylase-like protein
MKERFESWEVALVAYNVGPTRVGRAIRAGKRPRSIYSRSILERWKSLSREVDPGEGGRTGKAGGDT